MAISIASSTPRLLGRATFVPRLITARAHASASTPSPPSSKTLDDEDLPPLPRIKTRPRASGARRVPPSQAASSNSAKDKPFALHYYPEEYRKRLPKEELEKRFGPQTGTTAKFGVEDVKEGEGAAADAAAAAGSTSSPVAGSSASAAAAMGASSASSIGKPAFSATPRASFSATPRAAPRAAPATSAPAPPPSPPAPSPSTVNPVLKAPSPSPAPTEPTSKALDPVQTILWAFFLLAVGAFAYEKASSTGLLGDKGAAYVSEEEKKLAAERAKARREQWLEEVRLERLAKANGGVLLGAGAALNAGAGASGPTAVVDAHGQAVAQVPAPGPLEVEKLAPKVEKAVTTTEAVVLAQGDAADTPRKKRWWFF